MSTTFQYRKRPVVIEAFQWTKEFVDAMEGTHTIMCPVWIMRAIATGDIKPSMLVPGLDTIRSKEGTLDLPYGNWVIRGVEGEIYSCDPAIFANTYDKVEEA